MILCSSFIAPSFLERNTVAAVHYRRTSRATFIQDVLVEIASVFAPSCYKFIRSLSATERPIRRSINVASPRATRGRGTIRIVGLLLPSTPPLPFLCSIFSTVSSLSLFELPSLISSTPTPTETVRWTRTVSLHNTARDNKFGGWRNRYRYSLGMNNREGDGMVELRGKCMRFCTYFRANRGKNLNNFQEIREIGELNRLDVWTMSNGIKEIYFRYL